MLSQTSRWLTRALAVLYAVLGAILFLAPVWSAVRFPPNPLTWVYVALIALTLIGFAALYLGMEAYRRRRRTAKRNAVVTLDRRD
jgi:drug/metabolite transporter (DMT)-like permease